ncbi:hypothetical protein CKM354_000821400 [Cercospora kikuchii]|uniref:Uncharacterized protein n=1 Tax=Cercospora kikuchii TaxID=84275 RepID=A0A9P3FJL2_9PEZI|nr:uncharacterized protein CKM354_000821400 [Cercospora kikuchii]GIZ45030.1 hypothetical protein CKM354_000821400 [Cercospora kikuchii]
MGPIPAKPAIIDEFSSISTDDDNPDYYLPVERDDDGLKRGRIASIMKSLAFTGKVGGQDRNFNEDAWNNLMQVVYDRDLYGNMTKLVEEVKKVQGAWDAMRSLGAAPEAARIEQIMSQLLLSYKSKGLRPEAPLHQPDAALGKELVTLNLALRQKVQNLAIGAKNETLSAAIENVRKQVSNVAFDMVEMFVKNAGERYAGLLPKVIAAFFQPQNYFGRTETIQAGKDFLAMMMDFWEFYRRVRNTQTHAALMNRLARNIEKWLKSTPSSIAARLTTLLLDMQGNMLCGEFTEAWKIYTEEIKPALQLENQTFVPNILAMHMPANAYTYGRNTHSGNDEIPANLPNCVLIHGLCEIATPASGVATFVGISTSKGPGEKSLRVVPKPKDATGTASWFNLPKSLLDSGDIQYGYEGFAVSDGARNVRYDKPFAKGIKPRVFAWLANGYMNQKAGAGTRNAVFASPVEDSENEYIELKVDHSEEVLPYVGYLAIHPRRTDIIGKVINSKLPDAQNQGVTKNELLKAEEVFALHTNPPTLSMPIVTTFISGYESKDRVKATTVLPTSSNTFVHWETRGWVTHTTFAYWPSDDQKVILPSFE